MSIICIIALANLNVTVVTFFCQSILCCWACSTFKLSHMTIEPLRQGFGHMFSCPVASEKTVKRTSGHEWCFCLCISLTQIKMQKRCISQTVGCSKYHCVVLVQALSSACVLHTCLFVHLKNCALAWKMLNLCHMWRAQLHSCSDLRCRPILPDWKLCSRPAKWADMWHAHLLHPRSCFPVAMEFLLFKWDDLFKVF